MIKNTTNIIGLFFLLLIFSCKEKNNKIISETIDSFAFNPIETRDTLKNSAIDSIIYFDTIIKSKINDDSKIDKAKILELYLSNLKKEKENPWRILNWIETRLDMVKIAAYDTLTINESKFPIYLIHYYFENDADYHALLLTDLNDTNAVILYENTSPEIEYLRVSQWTGNKIESNIYEIDPFEYENGGDIIGEKQIPDTTKLYSISHKMDE